MESSLSLSDYSSQEDEEQSKLVTEWNCVTIWDDEFYRILQKHQSVVGDLFTARALSMLLLGRLEKSLEQKTNMDWRQDHFLAEVTTGYLDSSSSGHRLLVKEIATTDNRTPNSWDMVISQGCEKIAQEIVSKVRTGAKSVLCIWNGTIRPYTEEINHTVGQITLKPTNWEDQPLGVLIFHQELPNQDRVHDVQLRIRNLPENYEASFSHQRTDISSVHVKQIVVLLKKNVTSKTTVKKKKPLKERVKSYKEKLNQSRALVKSLQQTIDELESSVSLLSENLDMEKDERKLEVAKLERYIKLLEEKLV